MRLVRLAGLFASTVVLATPAFADSSSLSLIAKLLAGLTDGGAMIQGSLGKGDVKVIGDGAYEVTFAKASQKFLYDEPDTCRFTQHVQMNGDSSEARLDFSKVTNVDVRDQGTVEGLHGALVTFEGEPDLLQVMLNNGLASQTPAFAFLASSVSVDELNAAAAELLRIC